MSKGEGFVRNRVVRVVFVGVLLTLLYWWSDSLLHAYLDSERDLLSVLFYPRWHELMIRCATLVFLLALTGYGALAVATRERSRAMGQEEENLRRELDAARARELKELEARLREESRVRQEVEAKLSKSLGEWERTFDSVPDLIAVMDLHHRILRMNKAMAERLASCDYTPAGPKCHACMHGTDSPVAGCPYGKMLADGKEHTLEIREDHLGGFFLVSVTPILDETGALCGAIHVARDITARKRMEDALREARDELENRVKARTVELDLAVEQLGREIEVRYQAENDLLESQRFLQSSLDALSAHVITLDDTGRILSVNKAWKEFADKNGLKYPDYAVGANYLDVCDSARGSYSDEAAAVAHGIRQVVAREKAVFTTEYPCAGPDKELWFTVKVTRFTGEGPLRVVVAHENITERKQAELKLLHDAFHDPLTALPNRALFLDRLGHAARHSKALDDYLFAVLFLDLDDFKLVNDSLGHFIGDHLLLSISERLQAAVRPMDTVARIGGDEFAILLDGLRDPGEAAHLAGRVLRHLRDPFHAGGHEVYTSASIGIALSDTGFEGPHDLLRDADTALYRAKALGKSRHEIFDPEMHHQVVRRLQMETDLRHALGRDEFEVHYQPLVSLRTLELVGFEALLRWHHPAEGMILPTEFIPVAEDSGLIVPIGMKVLRDACLQGRKWIAAYPSFPGLMMSVNLSLRQLRQTDLAGNVRDILNASGFPASNLKLEITESSLMEDPESAATILSQLTEMGVRLSIDDFGTGYSSLSHLKRLPVHFLKIDRSFVGRLHREGEDYEIVKAIITLAHSLRKEVIAEGPERLEQVQILRSLGCEYGQGFFFAKPMPASDAEALLVDGKGSWGQDLPGWRDCLM